MSIEIAKGNRSIQNIQEKRIMKKVNKVLVAILLCGIIFATSTTTNAGIIVNLADQKAESQCTEKQYNTDVKVDSGIIVNLTGVIVNFTGVIVNFTGVIVNLSTPDNTNCGYIPTSD